MRHHRSGKKLGRDASHRKALYANLAGALIEHGRIKTTVTKAKAVKPFAEQMITLGRRGDLHARRQAMAHLRSQEVVHKLFAEVAPRFAGRPGGYSRIVRIGPRPGDAAEMAFLELVDFSAEEQAEEKAAAPPPAAPPPRGGRARRRGRGRRGAGSPGRRARPVVGRWTGFSRPEACSDGEAGVSVARQRGLVDHDALRRPLRREVAELADLLHDRHPGGDAAEHGVERGQPEVASW